MYIYNNLDGFEPSYSAFGEGFHEMEEDMEENVDGIYEVYKALEKED